MRAATMARILLAASSIGMMSIRPEEQGQRLGDTWSSMMTADAPAFSNSRMVRMALTALP